MTTTTPTIHIDDTSFRFALVRHLSAALSCVTHPHDLNDHAPDVKVTIDGEDKIFAIGVAMVCSNYDCNCVVVLELWHEGEVIGELSVEFADYGATIVPGKLFMKV